MSFFLNTNKQQSFTDPFKVWKTITLGTRNSAQDLKNDLIAQNVVISRFADNLLGQVKISPPGIYDVFRGRIEDLGFPGGLQENLWSHLRNLGFEQCPQDLAAEVCLNYPDQPKNEWLRFYMDPVKLTFEKSLYVFETHRDLKGIRRFHWYFGEPKASRNCGMEYIYCKKRV